MADDCGTGQDRDLAQPGSQRPGIGQGNTMSDLRNMANRLALAAYQASEQGEPLGECLEVAEWISLIERKVAELVA